MFQTITTGTFLDFCRMADPMQKARVLNNTRIIMRSELGKGSNSVKWQPSDDLVIEYMRRCSSDQPAAVNNWLDARYRAETRAYEDHVEAAWKRERATNVPEESEDVLVPPLRNKTAPNQGAKVIDDKARADGEMGLRGNDSHGKFWALTLERSPSRKKARREPELSFRTKRKPKDNHRETIRRDAGDFLDLEVFNGRRIDDAHIDALEAEAANQAEYDRAIEMADRDFQRFELEMSDYEFIALGDSLDEHLDGPMVYDLYGWLEEFGWKAGERGWPEGTVPQGKVVVLINRETLAENMVLFNFAGYRGQNNPHSVGAEPVFNHPATGGETGLLSKGGFASTLGDDDIPGDFRSFQGARDRIRASVNRGRRA